MADTHLTPKQAQFVIEYLIDLNATQAAIRAGYSESSAGSIGEENLTKPEIAKEIQYQMDARATRTLITADKVLHEMFGLASVDINECFDDNGDMKPLNQMPLNVRKAISSIEIDAIYEMQDDTSIVSGPKRRRKVEVGQTKKIRFWDKAKNLENLARHLKLLTDKTEHTGPGGVPMAFPEMKIVFVESKEEVNG